MSKIKKTGLIKIVVLMIIFSVIISAFTMPIVNASKTSEVLTTQYYPTLIPENEFSFYGTNMVIFKKHYDFKVGDLLINEKGFQYLEIVDIAKHTNGQTVIQVKKSTNKPYQLSWFTGWINNNKADNNIIWFKL